MRYPICLAVLILWPVASANTIWVPDDHATIQGAIDSAVAGDEIIVRAGTYVELLDIDGKAITVRSERGPRVTTVDGNFLGSVVTIANVGPSTIFEGFTVTNGTGTGAPSAKGGGLHLTFASPNLANCVVEGNTAVRGGGIYGYDHSSPQISDCTFTNLGGGAIYLEHFCSPTIEDCLIDGNQGAGIEIRDYGDPYLYDNVITNNDVAGVVLVDFVNVLIGRCSITHNAGPGLISNVTDFCYVTHSDISHNTGSGMSTYGTPLTVVMSTLLHNGSMGISGYYVTMNVDDCCIAGNSKGGLNAWNCAVDVERCTIARNTSSQGAGGIEVLWDHDNGLCVVTNSILWDNSGLHGPEVHTIVSNAAHTASFTIDYSNVKGGQASVALDPTCSLSWGAGMIDADPLFFDANADNFHLQQDPVQPGVINPCVDAGNPFTPVLETSTRTDWVRDGGVLDMGFHYVIPRARATFRNDGMNPASYSAQTLPILGSTYVGQVDLGGTTSHALALLAAYASPLSFHLPGGQMVLVNGLDPNGELLGWPSAAGPMAVFNVPLPLDYTLAGVQAFTQAVHVGGILPFALSNAQDLHLGL